MTYNEWRDELKSNLLSVSESERKRVLDYYAEAYADRREAGFSESEIINGFGAPYDAAKRILADNASENFSQSGAYAPQPSGDASSAGGNAAYGKRQNAQNRANVSAKSVFLTILFAFLSVCFLGWACSSVVEACSSAIYFFSSFMSGETLSGLASTGECILHIGCLIIAVALTVICVKTFIKYVKILTGGGK